MFRMREWREKRQRQKSKIGGVCILAPGSDFVPYDLEVKIGSHTSEPSCITMVSTSEEEGYSFSDNSSQSFSKAFIIPTPSMDADEKLDKDLQTKPIENNDKDMPNDNDNRRLDIPDSSNDEDWFSYVFVDQSGSQDVCLHNFICDIEDTLSDMVNN
mmetsp:Transcript_27525/g.41652  ORF Transcript_27525/g.41652 Transcript_27525/m.41652 type:complete len:157 (+) Transcript_27525:105-575(+)